QFRHARVDAAPVQLDLRLTRTTASHTRALAADLTTRLPRHGFAPTAKSREQILQLREFNLRATLTALSVLTEDVEDHRCAVNHLDSDDVFERAPLARRQFRIGDDRVSAGRGDNALQ